MELPSKLVVGTQVFEIVLRDRRDDGMLNEGSLGYTLDTENLIVIDSALSATKKRATLLHELLHAIRMVFGTSIKPSKRDDFEAWEHYFIGLYEEGLLIVFRDNPELIDYLKK